MSDAAHIEQQAAEWLSRREQPDWSPADQAALDTWLDASVAHTLAYWRLEYGWAKVARLAAVRSATAPDWPRRRTLRPWRIGAMAASVAAVAMLVFLFTDYRWAGGTQGYETQVGGRESVPLPDGSRVELNTDSKLRAAMTGEKREVWLERGEAYFEVKHDRMRPFVVWAGDRRITVLGTKFSVRRDGARVRVAVAEGRVQVDPVRPSEHARPQIVTPDTIVVAQGASTLVAAASPVQVSNALSWRRGMLTFDQVTLAEAAEEFNRHNTTQLVFTDAAVAQIRIGGTFETGNVDAFARLLASAYGLHVDDQGSRIEISR